MVLKYVVAGTDPPSWWSNELHILLMNAVKARWTATYTDIPVERVNFNTTWFTDSIDIEFSFIPLRDDFRRERRSIGWIRRNTYTYVQIHMWIRGAGISGTPPWLHTAKQALLDIVDNNELTLLPPAVVTIEDADPIPDPNHLSTTYHYLFDVTIAYDKVKVNIP